MAVALAMGLDRVAERLVTGDIVEQVLWTRCLDDAYEILRAAHSGKGGVSGRG